MAMTPAFDLRAWLKRAPKPRKLKLTVADGDERMVDLGTGRTRWPEVEQTVINAGTTLIECLDAEGEIIRSYRLEDEREDENDKHEKLVGKTQAASASMLDAYGKRMVESFRAGAEAASVSQENLVAIVETLSSHLSLAITNLHTLSVNMANLVSQQGAGDGGDGKADALMNLLGSMIGQKQLATAPPPATNGRGK